MEKRKMTYLSIKQYMDTYPEELNMLLCTIYRKGYMIPTEQLKKIRNIWIHPNQDCINSVYRPLGGLELLDENTLFWLREINIDKIPNKKQRKEIRKKKFKRGTKY